MEICVIHFFFPAQLENTTTIDEIESLNLSRLLLNKCHVNGDNNPFLGLNFIARIYARGFRTHAKHTALLYITIAHITPHYATRASPFLFCVLSLRIFVEQVYDAVFPREY